MTTLDATDWQLLGLLQQDARLGYRELDRRVGLSPPAVSARVRRLESLQVITGYSARIDPAKAGWAVQAFIVLSTKGIRQSHQTAHIARPHRTFSKTTASPAPTTTFCAW